MAKSDNGTMKREEILDIAKAYICGERDKQYGKPENNFGTIAVLWTTYLNALGITDDMLSAKDVAAMMILLKVARIASGAGKRDNWIDIAGYAACGGEVEYIDGEG